MGCSSTSMNRIIRTLYENMMFRYSIRKTRSPRSEGMEAVLADSTLDLTPEWFTAALREGGVIGPDNQVVAADAGLFGTGQFGLVARAELKYDDDVSGAPSSVIVKLPSADQGSRELGIAIGAYEAE